MSKTLYSIYVRKAISINLQKKKPYKCLYFSPIIHFSIFSPNRGLKNSRKVRCKSVLYRFGSMKLILGQMCLTKCAQKSQYLSGQQSLRRVNFFWRPQKTRNWLDIRAKKLTKTTWSSLKSSWNLTFLTTYTVHKNDDKTPSGKSVEASGNF